MQKTLGAIAALALVGACGQQDEASSQTPTASPAVFSVETIGAQRETIMEGKRDGQIVLSALPEGAGLIALGPIAGLTGEITIVDGNTSLARVGPDGLVQTSSNRDAAAPFLVWADVSGGWAQSDLPGSVQTIADLEQFVAEQARRAGINGAFPFKVQGAPTKVGIHVLKADPSRPHPAGMDAHKEIQAHFEIGETPITFAGFYSEEHEGVFTHMGAVSHIHAVTDDRSLSGHVETIEFGGGPFKVFIPVT